VNVRKNCNRCAGLRAIYWMMQVHLLKTAREGKYATNNWIGGDVEASSPNHHPHTVSGLLLVTLASTSPNLLKDVIRHIFLIAALSEITRRDRAHRHCLPSRQTPHPSVAHYGVAKQKSTRSAQGRCKRRKFTMERSSQQWKADRPICGR
jgi:hypothetical protein